MVRGVYLAAGLTALLSTSALAQPPAPAPKVAAPPGAQVPAPAAAKAEPPKIEEKVRCDRDLRGVGSIIGKRTCETRSEREQRFETDAPRAEAERENAQQFLQNTLTVPALEGGL